MPIQTFEPLQALLLEAAEDDPLIVHPADKLAVAVRDLLAADPLISSPNWCGQRVFRVANAFAPVAVADPPYVAVSVKRAEHDWRFSGRQLLCGIHVAVVAIDRRAELGPEDLSVLSAGWYVQRLLTMGPPEVVTLGGIAVGPPKLSDLIPLPANFLDLSRFSDEELTHVEQGVIWTLDYAVQTDI